MFLRAGKTAFVVAVERGKLPIIRVLIEKGAAQFALFDPRNFFNFKKILRAAEYVNIDLYTLYFRDFEV